MKALINLGYGADFILPFEDAVVLIRTLENAEGYMRRYDNGDETMYIIPNNTKIKIECLTDDQYAVAKMRGEPTQQTFNRE